MAREADGVKLPVDVRMVPTMVAPDAGPPRVGDPVTITGRVSAVVGTVVSVQAYHVEFR